MGAGVCAVAYPSPPNQANQEGKSRVMADGRCVHMGVLEACIRHSKTTAGEFTLETDRLRDAVPQFYSTIAHAKKQSRRHTGALGHTQAQAVIYTSPTRGMSSSQTLQGKRNTATPQEQRASFLP